MIRILILSAIFLLSACDSNDSEDCLHMWDVSRGNKTDLPTHEFAEKCCGSFQCMASLWKEATNRQEAQE